MTRKMKPKKQFSSGLCHGRWDGHFIRTIPEYRSSTRERLNNVAAVAFLLAKSTQKSSFV